MNVPVVCSPAIIMCAATSRTFQPSHNVLADHCSGDRDSSMSAARARSSWIIRHTSVSLLMNTPRAARRDRTWFPVSANVSSVQLPTDRDDGESIQEVLPSLFVVRDRVVRQTAVHESYERFVTLGNQRDGDVGRSGRYRMSGFIPPEGEDDFLIRDNLDEIAQRRRIEIGRAH